jgi:putative spermidine/putrescine transport system ATP-binding protein
MPRPLVTLVGVSKTYGRTIAVNKVSLEVGEGEFVTLLGPSGSGKTTTLMLIAGFEQPSEGEILVRGESVVTRPPEKRDIGMVFQSYALFPHMTVFENVAFPLKTRRVSSLDLAKRVDEALAAVRMSGLGARYPRQLSGGQQQRVALARALVYRPSLLLMDEPLGALDKKLREEMQSEIKSLQRELGITTIYVTHDQQEALALSDRIAILNGGDVIQVGSPLALYEQPATDFVAGFLGDINLVEGVVAGSAGDLVRVQVGDGPEVLTLGGPSLAPGKRVRMTIRPERLEIKAGGPAGPHTWRGRVRELVFHGELVRYGVEVPSSVVFRVTRPFRGPDTLFAVGEEVWLTSRPEDWRLFA